MRRALGFIGLLAYGAGCAATAASTSAPMDAPAEVGLSLRVGLGPLVPPTYRAGVRVRASDGRGQTVDAVTDAAGWVRLPLDASRRWDVTAAEPGHVAVSLLGVPVPTATEVYLRATAAVRPAEVRDVTVSGVIRGRTVAGAQVLLEGGAGNDTTPAEDFAVSFETWPGAPPSYLIAIERRGDSGFVNGVVSAPIFFRGAAPGVTLVVQLPAPPVPPAVQELRIDLPTIGRVTAARFGPVLSEVVARVKYTGAGADLAEVGRSQLRRPTDPSAARWTVEAFEGELAPDLISATVRFDGAEPVRGSVTTRPSFRGVVPAFGTVTELAATSGAAGEVALTVDALAWSRPAFTASTGEMVVWEGYGFDGASWRDQPLPPLPPGVTLAMLWPSVVRQATVRACVLRDWPAGTASWSSPLRTLALRNLITVCEENGAIVPVR